jgi:hypothetical protein
MKNSVRFETILSVLISLLFTAGILSASEEGSWSIAVGGDYSAPVGGLSDWFKPSNSFSLALGKQQTAEWHVQGMISHTRYDKENLTGYPAGKLNLSLEHTAIMLNAKYRLTTLGGLYSYWNGGVGLYYWKGVRGQIDPDPNMEPVIPLIEERVLEEWNWGFRTGLGIGIEFLSRFNLDVTGYYRFIVGDLWPTLQPHIELEGVYGFQSLNLEVELKYFLR